jgi:hypothetical protein
VANTITCILALPFFKQGDDLGMLLHQGMTNTQALVTYAEHLDEASRLLRRLSAGMGSQPIAIVADAHVICVEGPEEVLMPLVKDGTLQLYPYEEEWAEEEPAHTLQT